MTFTVLVTPQQIPVSHSCYDLRAHHIRLMTLFECRQLWSFKTFKWFEAIRHTVVSRYVALKKDWGWCRPPLYVGMRLADALALSCCHFQQYGALTSIQGGAWKVEHFSCAWWSTFFCATLYSLLLLTFYVRLHRCFMARFRGYNVRQRCESTTYIHAHWRADQVCRQRPTDTRGAVDLPRPPH